MRPAAHQDNRLPQEGAAHVKLLAEMFSVGPGNKDHHPALRCATGVFVPLITLVLLGRLDLAIFASFGALAPGGAPALFFFSFGSLVAIL